MQISDASFGQKTFALGNVTHVIFLTKDELVYKNPLKRFSPQITIPKSTKSGRNQLTFFTQLTLKQLPIYDGTKTD